MFEQSEAGREARSDAPIDPFTGRPSPPRLRVPLVEPVEVPEAYDAADRRPPVHPAVAALQAGIAAVARAQAEGSLAAGSLVDTAALLRAAEGVQGLALVEVAAVDRTGSHRDVGRASAAGWVGATLTITEQAARAKVALSRRLTEDLLAVGDLLVDGGTTLGHCTATVQGLRGIRPEVVAACGPALVTLARTLDPTCLARELRERALAVSPELAREQEKRQRQRVGVTASELLDGCVKIDGLLDPESGQVWLAAVDAQMTKDRTARGGLEADDRDAPARRADALVALARHALDCDGLLPANAGARPTIHVVVQADTLLDPAPAGSAGTPGRAPAAFAGSNALLTRQHLLRLSCDADVSRVVLDPGGHVLDLGRTRRTVTPAQHRALVARDQGCIVKGCRRRPAETEAHHLWHWALGGPSDLSNYALVCHLHHHQLHEGGRTLQARDGRWITPTGYTDVDPPPF